MNNNTNNGDSPTQVVKLSDYKGKPYISVMTEDSSGIYAKVEVNAAAKVKIQKAATILAVFDDKLSFDSSKIYDYFKGGRSDIEQTLEQLVGDYETPESLKAKVYDAIDSSELNNPDNQGLVTVELTDLILMACDSYTEIDLGSENTFYNVAYLPSDSRSGTKSGRTYSWPATREVQDPSDYAFLSELSQLSIDDMPDLYAELNKFMVSSDTTDLSTANSTAVDFMAVYTAELIRYVMVKFKKDPWAIDLAQVTFLAAYVNVSGMLILAAKFTSGSITDYASKGSIGEERDDFVQLSTDITNYLHKNHSSLVKSLENLTGSTGTTDILRATLSFLTTPMQNDLSTSDQSTLIEKMGQLVQVFCGDADKITSYIEQNGQE